MFRGRIRWPRNRTVVHLFCADRSNLQGHSIARIRAPLRVTVYFEADGHRFHTDEQLRALLAKGFARTLFAQVLRLRCASLRMT